MKKLFILTLLILVSCGKGFNTINNNPYIPNSAVLKAKVTFQVSQEVDYVSSNYKKTPTIVKLLNITIYKATAAVNNTPANGSVTISYSVPPSVTFTISTSNLGNSNITWIDDNTLSLGAINLLKLNDNTLKVCPTAPNNKCNRAYIRLYTTGSIFGFVSSDNYGLPINSNGLDVGLGNLNSAQVQKITLATNKNKITQLDFTSLTYPLVVDFSNGGSSSYTTTLVMEYLLGYE